MSQLSDAESCRQLGKLLNFGKVAENARSCRKLKELWKKAKVAVLQLLQLYCALDPVVITDQSTRVPGYGRGL